MKISVTAGVKCNKCGAKREVIQIRRFLFLRTGICQVCTARLFRLLGAGR